MQVIIDFKFNSTLPCKLIFQWKKLLSNLNRNRTQKLFLHALQVLGYEKIYGEEEAGLTRSLILLKPPLRGVPHGWIQLSLSRHRKYNRIYQTSYKLNRIYQSGYKYNRIYQGQG